MGKWGEKDMDVGSEEKEGCGDGKRERERERHIRMCKFGERDMVVATGKREGFGYGKWGDERRKAWEFKGKEIWMLEKGERERWALKQRVSPTPLDAAPHLSVEQEQVWFWGTRQPTLGTE